MWGPCKQDTTLFALSLNHFNKQAAFLYCFFCPTSSLQSLFPLEKGKRVKNDREGCLRFFLLMISPDTFSPRLHNCSQRSSGLTRDGMQPIYTAKSSLLVAFFNVHVRIHQWWCWSLLHKNQKSTSGWKHQNHWPHAHAAAFLNCCWLALPVLNWLKLIYFRGSRLSVTSREPARLQTSPWGRHLKSWTHH